MTIRLQCIGVDAFVLIKYMPPKLESAVKCMHRLAYIFYYLHFVKFTCNNFLSYN